MLLIEPVMELKLVSSIVALTNESFGISLFPRANAVWAIEITVRYCF